MTATPYADYADQQLAAGYSPVPVAAGKKAPPETGWTGKTAPMATSEDVEQFVRQQPTANIGCRLPDGVIAIDVDDYDGKDGATTLGKAEAELGALPAAPCVTSRGADSPSRKMLLRVPPGTVLVANLDALFGLNVDVLQHVHRYCLAPGSIHPDGSTVQAYDGGGTPLAPGHMPAVDTLPELPVTWLEALTKPTPQKKKAAKKKISAVVRPMTVAPWAAAYLTAARERQLKRLRSARPGQRNTLLFEVVTALLELANADWTGDYSRDDVYRDVLDATPLDDDFDQAEVDKTFGSAVTTVGDKARPLPEGHGDERPRLLIGSAASMAVWLKANIGTGPLAGVMRRGGDLVHTPRLGEDGYIAPRNDKDDDGPAQVRELNIPRLATKVWHLYDCYTTKEMPDGSVVEVEALFPEAAAKTAVFSDDGDLPHVNVLRGVVHGPTMRADGTILAEPGYDEATGLLYLPTADLVVPAVSEEPSAEEVAAARGLLERMVAEFDFVTEHDQANYLGLLLTPALRAMVPPPYKLGAITAPQPGSGKTLLADVLRTVHGGVLRSEMPHDEAEMAKSLMSILDQTTGPVVQFDNVTGILRSSKLAGLLTNSTYSDRILGASKNVTRPNDRLWLVTGNNMAIGGDLPRRTIKVTIDPRVPDPHKRTGFAIPDLTG
jgi:hypothetical protein